MKRIFLALTRLISLHLMPVITVAVILSLTLVALVGWNVWGMYSSYTKVVTTEFHLQSTSGTITHLDEVLTMSARMAATTGDLKWEKRYRQFEPKLDAAIKQAIKLAPETYASHAAQTDAANIKLVAMENRAFDLVRQGKRKEALELLLGEQYETQKQIYANGMNKTVVALQQRVVSNLETYHQRLFWSSLFCIISFPILVLAWLAILGLVRWYMRDRQRAEKTLQMAKIELEHKNTNLQQAKAALAQANETLEQKVSDRTAQLAQANAAITELNEKLQAENLRMAAEINVARQIQKMILPKTEELQQIEGLDIAGFMEPADEVGGDYYDVLYTDGVVTLAIGDVTGHGLESGLLMLMTQTAVRTLKEIRESDSVRFLDALNRTIYKNVQRMNSDKSLTLVILNYSQGQISISGQHEEAIAIRNGQVERIDTIDLGFPIGLDDDIADFISHTTLELQPGDGIVLYTDGITEAKNINKVQYGVEQLCKVISDHWHKSAQEIKDIVIADVRRHIGKQKVFDDITLLVFKRHSDSPQPTINSSQRVATFSQVVATGVQ